LKESMRTYNCQQVVLGIEKRKSKHAVKDKKGEIKDLQ